MRPYQTPSPRTVHRRLDRVGGASLVNLLLVICSTSDPLFPLQCHFLTRTSNTTYIIQVYIHLDLCHDEPGQSIGLKEVENPVRLLCVERQIHNRAISSALSSQATLFFLAFDAPRRSFCLSVLSLSLGSLFPLFALTSPYFPPSDPVRQSAVRVQPALTKDVMGRSADSSLRVRLFVSESLHMYLEVSDQNTSAYKRGQ